MKKTDTKEMMEEVLIQEIFADPTYDITFKMLFANDANKDILISFLNNLLGFENENAIKSLDIMNPYLGQEYVSGIQSTIDVRCKTNSNKDISIEMQRKNKDYFLSRSQDYMAKLISTQVKEGEAQEYHIKLSDTYILVLAKQNLFTGQYKLTGDSNAFYEKTFKPTCEELGHQEMPGNKMHWKFFELTKFKTFTKNKTIDNSNSLKAQWLDFLVNCNKNLEIPENMNEIIKKGYNIMKMANWNPKEKDNYYKIKANEYDEQITKENELKQAEFKGELKGKWKGELKGEIKQIKSFMDVEKQMSITIPKETYLQKLNYTKPFFEQIKEHLSEGHFDDTESVILGDLKSSNKMDIEYQNDFDS